MRIRTYVGLLKQAFRKPVVNPIAIEIANIRIRRTITIDTINIAQQHYREQTLGDPQGATKYCDYAYWMRTNIIRAARLRLHKASKLKILDLGCGAGYFVAVCRYLGHEALGADLPPDEMNLLDATVYPILTAALGRGEMILPLKISRFTKLDIVGEFDLITAFMICFNSHATPDVWGVSEWEFFLDDVRLHLRPEGRLFLQLNHDSKCYPHLHYYSPEQLKMFSRFGVVDRDEILIRK